MDLFLPPPDPDKDQPFESSQSEEPHTTLGASFSPDALPLPDSPDTPTTDEELKAIANAFFSKCAHMPAGARLIEIKSRFEQFNFQVDRDSKNPQLFDTLFWKLKNTLVIITAEGNPEQHVSHYFVNSKPKPKT